MSGCGCKICKSGLGEFTNELILDGEQPKSVLNKLKNRGVIASVKLLKKHLAAYEIPYPDEQTNDDDITCKPVTVDLNKIDFSQYNFDDTDPETFIALVQKITMQVFLNQSKITLQSQQDVIDGLSPDVPKEILQNLSLAYQMLEKSTAMNVRINQNVAIKVVESMGLTIQNQAFYLPNNVENQPEPETD